MKSFKDYLSGYGLKPVAEIRIDGSLYEKCASDNSGGAWQGIGLTPENVLYSARSLAESKRRYDEFEYIGEAELKTYPTDKFLKLVLKTVSNSCGFKDVVIGPTLAGDYLRFAGGKVCIDDEFDAGAGLCGAECYIYANYGYVENGIAGRVQLTLGFSGAACGLEARLTAGLKDIIKNADYCGYNYVLHQLYDARGGFRPEFVFESKFQSANLKISNKLYHIAPASLKEKILKFGIAPKSKSRAGGRKICHPDRVYMFNLYDEFLFLTFCRQAGKKNCGYSRDLKLPYSNFDYCIFEIDRNKVPDLVLFRDNNFQSPDRYNPVAVYSYTNIPPAAVCFLKDFNLTDMMKNRI